VKIHIVQKGDTLWKIAKKYGVNFEELKKMNSQLSNPDMIMPGMKIKVPTTGGSVKKEAPILGAKKEMPIAQMPIVKEQPKPLPVAEAPIKEAPIMPIKEAPKAPVMPQPVIPEIDINNYYMLNMAQMNVQQPQLPPKPTNILPEVKEVPKKEAPIVEAPKKEAPIKEAPVVEAPIKEEPIKEIPIMESPIEQPAYQEYCVPVSPILPGSGLFPGWCPPPPCPPQPFPPGVPYQQQVMPFDQFPGTMNPGMLPGVENPTYLADMDESSDFMPQLPLSNPMAQNPTAVMGVEDVAQQAPVGYGLGQDNCLPTSPVLPGVGGGFAGAPFGGQQMPYQQPFGGQQMPYQQPFGSQQMPYQQPFGGQQMPYQQPFGGQQMPYQQPFGGQQMPYQQPFGGQQMPYQQPFGGQQMPYQQPFGGQQMPYQQPFDDQEMPYQQPFGSQQMPYQQPFGGQMPFQQMPYVGRQMNMQQQMPYEGDDQIGMQQMPFENQQMMQQLPPQQQQFGGQQMPFDQQQFGGQQLPFDQQQFGGQQMPYQQPFGGPQMQFESPQMPLMPQGQGVNFESPEFMGMPGMPFNSPHMAPGGFNYDCGCGGPKIQPKAPVNPYGQGTPGIYTPPYGAQMGQPPFMNPYGYGPSADSNRGFDESSEFY
jgi:morphogenetic protein associated with SpoVID